MIQRALEIFFNGETSQEETKSEPTPPTISNRTTTQPLANDQINFDPFGFMK